MNIIDALGRRSVGYENPNSYVHVLYRLKCYERMSVEADDEEFPNITAVRFCTTLGYDHILAFSDDVGCIALHDTANDEIYERPYADEEIDSVQPVNDIAWMPGELKFVSASEDGTISLWEVSNRSSMEELETYNTSNSTSIPTTVMFNSRNKAIFASGDSDGTINLWDTQVSRGQFNQKPEIRILRAHESRSQFYRRNAINLAFQDEFSLLSCNRHDSFIKLWDIRKLRSARSQKEMEPETIMKYASPKYWHGFISILVSPDGSSIYGSCADSHTYKYNGASLDPDPVAEFNGIRKNCAEMCLSPDGMYLASGSSVEYAYIWNTSAPGLPMLKLCGHQGVEGNVCYIDWCISQPMLVTYTTQGYYRTWRTNYTEVEEQCQLQGWAEDFSLDSQSPHMNFKTEN